MDKNRFYSLDTTRILTGKNLTYFLGIFNSKFFFFTFRNYYAGGHLGSRGVRFKSEFMKNFPMPPITDVNRNLVNQIERLVDQIIEAKHTDPEADTSSLENEIDKLVYALYNLTEDEIAIVRGVSESRIFADDTDDADY